MKSDSHLWKWSEGPVDRQADHFEVQYENASGTGPDKWVLVALVGRSASGTFNVEFLIDRSDPENSTIIKTV